MQKLNLLPGKKQIPNVNSQLKESLYSGIQLKSGKIIYLRLILSPVLRAVQTAEHIKNNIGFPSDILKDNLLKPGADALDILHIIKTHKTENLILVGHQPDLSNAISSFLGYDNFDIPFKPASIAKISFDGRPAPGRGFLEILIPPVIK